MGILGPDQFDAPMDFDIGREGKTLMLHQAGAKEGEIVKTSTANGWQEEIDYFLACVENKKRPTVTTAADAVKSVALVQAELKSARTRKVVNV